MDIHTNPTRPIPCVWIFGSFFYFQKKIRVSRDLFDITICVDSVVDSGTRQELDGHVGNHHREEDMSSLANGVLIEPITDEGSEITSDEKSVAQRGDLVM